MKKRVLGLLLACAWMPVAMAMADESPATPSSISVGGLYEFPDNARDSDNGYGGHISFNLPLQSRPGEGLEFDFYGLKRDADAGGTDSQLGLFASYTKGFGLYGWDEDDGVERYLPSFSPYGLLGVGVIRDDVGNSDHYVPALDAGLGLAFPLGWRGLALRTEARVIGQFNDKSVPDQNFLLDVQLRVGLTFPLGAPAPAEEGVSDTALTKECGLAVVDPVTGRSDCTVDSDRDGVTDNADLCPGTPAGTPVDLNGCAATASFDSDGDGVPDEADSCPGSLASSAVDMSGCATGLAPVAGEPAPPPGTKTIVLSNVRFAKNSAELTPQAKSLLDQAAVGLSGDSEIVVEVAGHTDSEGKANYNLMLSLLRAENVRQYLVGKGISRYRLFVEGYGEAKPVGSNETEAGRAQNRRVDLDKLDVKVIEK
ncbi:MAG: OmpA-OmpF porin, family [Hydrocarboniphaga sp.]|uniref:OmpA family protein n=1 Tax=Hydrocarboniphaga sp. TaxID=2033016 RepID=UPI002606C442|nr:OmpA family protein [Hydrocarboniphaga sp.]MDB5969487.1 OmpA-OmpF porin, family [Hydrocarboniphaga sp.]